MIDTQAAPPVGAALAGGTRIHAVYEARHQVIYLGSRVTDTDPDALAIGGHVTALLRAASGTELGDLRGVIKAFAGGRPVGQWRLRHDGRGEDPVLGDPRRLCACGLDLDPPAGVPHWWPHRDPEPPSYVYAVAVCGESPLARRVVRRDDGQGWLERGHCIYHPGFGSITLKWPEVGLCPEGKFHAVHRLGL